MTRRSKRMIPHPRSFKLPSAWQRNERELVVVRDLMAGIWGMKVDPSLGDAAAYIDHYSNLLASPNIVDQQTLTLRRSEDVLNLVNHLKGKSGASLKIIKDDICAHAPSYIPDVARADAISNAVDFSIRLWLFTEVDLTDEDVTLKESLAKGLAVISSKKASSSKLKAVTNDFSAKSLARKGGFTLVWTSYLTQHLTFATPSKLRVFRHASVLTEFNRLTSEERQMYPQDFLRETSDTLRLLFQPEDAASSKRNRRAAKKGPADIETGTKVNVTRDLKDYPVWRYRLAEVQKRYNATRPGSIRQWWFDRRNKPQWSTFWVAVMVFILTVVFGLVSSVTGIMQVYASFRATR